MSRPPNLCAYCQQPGKRSKEHFWGRWSRELQIDEGIGTRHYTTYQNSLELQNQDKLPARNKGVLNGQGNPAARSLKKVCKSCNSTWMSVIGNAAKIAATQFIKNRPNSLTPAEQISLARWACLFVMTYEFADIETLTTPQWERDWIRINSDPPVTWRIWVARGDTTFCTKTFHASVSYYAMGKLEYAQSTVFGLNNLIIQTFSTRLPVDAAFDKNITSLGYSRIWPISDQLVNRTRKLTGLEIESNHLNTFQLAFPHLPKITNWARDF